jgi:undecaprenyl-diphosphatase
MSPDVWRSLVEGALQGVTEFLPVSSSGHLVVVPALLGWASPPLSFDVAVHWATAAAVLLFFWRDWWAMARGLWRAARVGSIAGEPDARLALLVGLGTVPAVVIGLLFHNYFESLFQAPAAAARMLIVTGIILAGAEIYARRGPGGRPLTASMAVLIGLAQAAAIVPGISRSGATIAAGVALGLARDEAARFSFLLALPVIVGAGLVQLITSEGLTGGAALAAAVLTAFLIGYASIGWLLGFVRRYPLYPFAAYVVVLGLVAVWLLP